MGKGENKSVEDTSDDETISSEEKTNDEPNKEEDTEENNKSSDEQIIKKEVKVEDSDDEKKDKDDIRKIIKFDNSEQDELTEDGNLTPSRESLEQKRAILQSIKDFDFLIKKNQEEITELNQKFESVSKDLDDLVSLYEIVSEQMNPFVGLSKVTKKRIDALENFTKEIDNLKERTSELESFTGRSGANLKTHSELNQENQENMTGDEGADNVSQNLQALGPIDNGMLKALSDEDLDKILENALGAISSEDNIDVLIDEFIENLKD